MECVGEKTGNARAVMNYRNYEHDIMRNNGVKLVGWPSGIQMTKPGLIGAVTDLREIWSAIEKKQLRFEELTLGENAALRTPSVQANSNPDAVVPSVRKRKARSDKGVSRGPRKKKDSDEGGRRSKRQKQMEMSELWMVIQSMSTTKGYLTAGGGNKMSCPRRLRHFLYSCHLSTVAVVAWGTI
jgi:hypothetical protein